MIAVCIGTGETPIHVDFRCHQYYWASCAHRWFMAQIPQGLRISGCFSGNALGLPKHYRAAPKMGHHAGGHV
jgi:hypothetical protein